MELTLQSAESPYSMSFQNCIDDCQKCFEACIRCVPHCLKLGGKYAESRHISLIMECSEVTRTCLTLILSNSPYAYKLSQLCAQACEACAASCSEIDENDIHMRECINACHKCSESCLNLVL